jgi:predicted RNA polymerase sigma factor
VAAKTIGIVAVACPAREPLLHLVGDLLRAADLLRRLGRLAEAADAYERALELA